MSSIDIISMAIRNLIKRKLRTFLTIMGVVVGTAAIVVMISLGLAMNQSFEKRIEEMGDLTIIEVNNPNYYDSVVNENTKLTKSSVEEFKNIDGVKTATPLIEGHLKFQSGRKVASISVMGIDTSAMQEFSYKVSEGRLLDEEDENTLNIVMGLKAAYNFEKPGTSWRTRNWGDTSGEMPINPLEDKILMSYDYSLGEKRPSGDKSKKIKPYNIKCVGIFQEGDWNTDYYVYMSMTELEKILEAQRKYEADGSNRGMSEKNKGYRTVSVKCNSLNDVLNVQEALKELGYEAYSAIEYVNSMQETAKSLQYLLGMIGAVSLFIAAIGITNTMIMAIYERTREIGVMKVIGAQLKDIKKLFLLEASLIGFFGGLFGIGLSYISSFIMNNVEIQFLSQMSGSPEDAISIIPVWLCLVALAFSSVVGLISGYFPARRAMKLSALSALRTE